MSRNKIILGALVIILALTAFILIRRNIEKKDKVYDFSFREFAVEDIESINRIALFKRDGEIIELKKVGSGWIVNDKYPASPTAISNILSAIKNVRIDYVPPDAAVENIMKSLMYNGIKVELYDNNNKPVKKFYVGDSPENNIGTYYLMDGSASPLVLSLPGFKGNLRVRFGYTLDEWRDRTVYALAPDQIDKVSIKYFFDKKNSFTLKRENDGFTYFNPFQEYNKPPVIANKTYAKTYLLGFENKGCEYIANNLENKDDVLSRLPIVEIELQTIDKKVKKLEIFMIPNLDEEVDEEKEGLDKYLNDNVLRYIARDENGDLYLIQYEVFKDIFVRGSDFLR
ncbi:MAG: DUF4340 domain-containing protein [Deltaproteobacteria bacterium]